MKLYPFQQEAVDWLQDHPGLADDQGLGKTASAITACSNFCTILVICPTVVTFNWRKEIRQWAKMEGRNWTGPIQVVTAGNDIINKGARWVIVPHSLVAKFADELEALKWNCVIVDEAHAFKNRKAQRTKALYGNILRNRSDTRIMLLTGTPMPNDPTELWTHFAAVKPELISPTFDPITMLEPQPMSWFQFRKHYCELKPSNYGDGWKVVGTKKENLVELRGIVKKFWLRRMKKDVLDLPPIRFGTVAINAEVTKEQFDIEHGKTIQELRESEHFSTWRRLCGIAKAKAAGELLVDELAANPEKKIVVFAHHREVVDSLSASMAIGNIAFVTIVGSMDAEARARAVDSFQTDPTTRVAIVNIVAGGVGITLTAATDAVFVEQSWVPGDNLQATDRIYRIGQDKSVLVRFLSLANSIDEMISDANMVKTQMIQESLSS